MFESLWRENAVFNPQDPAQSLARKALIPNSQSRPESLSVEASAFLRSLTQSVGLSADFETALEAVLRQVCELTEQKN